MRMINYDSKTRGVITGIFSGKKGTYEKQIKGSVLVCFVDRLMGYQMSEVRKEARKCLRKKSVR